MANEDDELTPGQLEYENYKRICTELFAADEVHIQQQIQEQEHIAAEVQRILNDQRIMKLAKEGRRRKAANVL